MARHQIATTLPHGLPQEKQSEVHEHERLERATLQPERQCKVQGRQHQAEGQVLAAPKKLSGKRQRHGGRQESMGRL